MLLKLSGTCENPYFCRMDINFADTETQEQTFTLDEVLAGLKVNHRLILWNDDTNTFEHVIYCLVKYLDYSSQQAEKIAWTVHNDGKCNVLEGSFTELEVYRKILQQEGLTVSID
ncbi:MAG: ATP-dependent Clp protease adaptor ClpS [Sphingobacteriaceae bacterium]|nr:ATP-dependent Clp protease adaptor ClpS [Sphingobacteriaceae bacterium]